MNTLELDYDLTDLPWLIGPTEAQPFDDWLPGSVELIGRSFKLRRRHRRQLDYVTAVLTRVADPSRWSLPYVIFRWIDLAESPLVAQFGIVARESDEVADRFLASADLPHSRPAVLIEVPARGGSTVRRGVTPCDSAEGTFISVRYVADNGHPAGLALVSTGSPEQEPMVAVLPELDAFAGSLRVLPRRS